MYFKLYLLFLLICFVSGKQIKKTEQKAYTLNVVQVLKTFNENITDVENQISDALATLQALDLINRLIELLTYLRDVLQNSIQQVPVLDKILDRTLVQIDDITVGLEKLQEDSGNGNENVIKLIEPFLSSLKSEISTLEQLANGGAGGISEVK
jgi:hypothetical protein